MSERVMFGHNGTQFVARVARPTKAVTSTDLADYAMHEAFSTLVPVRRGTVTLAAGASTSFTESAVVGKYPFVVMKSVEGRLPSSPYWGTSKSFYMQIVPTTGACVLKNDYTTALTITYAIFISP